MSIGANYRHLSTVSSGGEIRDLGAGMELTGGEMSVVAAKYRRAAGESEVVSTALGTREPITITYEIGRVQSTMAWLQLALERGDAVATIRTQRLQGAVPVENVAEYQAVPIRVSAINSAEGDEDAVGIEVEYIVGQRA